MKRTPHRSLTLACVCGLLTAGTPAVVTRAEGADRANEQSNRKPASAKPPAPDVEPGAKVVPYGDKDVVRLKTKLRYTTLIVLPSSEQILDFAVGDKEFWVVNGAEHFAYIKPAKSGAQTNLNLITASGNIYSFVLTEVSESPQETPDLKVFVEPKDESMISAAGRAPKFVSSQTVDDYRQQIEMAKEETRQAKDSAQAAIDRGISQFVSNVRFPYRFEAGKKPFSVRAMYNDDKFTYIQARPEETPTLWEVKDGKPNMVDFEYRNGVYIVQKILEDGYLAIGKKKLTFTRED